MCDHLSKGRKKITLEVSYVFLSLTGGFWWYEMTYEISI